jgi:hypothetical protein
MEQDRPKRDTDKVSRLAPLLGMCLLFAQCRESRPLHSDAEWNAMAVMGVPPSEEFSVEQIQPGVARCHFRCDPHRFLEWFRRWQVAQDYLGSDYEDYSSNLQAIVQERGGAIPYRGKVDPTCNGVRCFNHVELIVEEMDPSIWAVSIRVQREDLVQPRR